MAEKRNSPTSTAIMVLVAVVCCALLILIGGEWLSPDDTGVAQAAEPPTAAMPTLTAASDEPLQNLPAPGPIKEEPNRMAVATSPPVESSDLVTLEIRILLESGEPAAGASIWFFDKEAPGLRERVTAVALEQGQGTMDSVFFHESVLAMGEAWTADEEGIAHKTWDGSSLMIAARSGGERAALQWRSGGPLLQTIHLAGAHELLVRVIDPSGQPRVGIPVFFEPGETPSLSRIVSGRWKGLSRSPDGVARIGGIRSNANNASTPIIEGRVAAEVLLEASPWQSIELSPWPREPIDLVVPDSGAVRVVIKGLPPGDQPTCILSSRNRRLEESRNGLRPTIKVGADGQAFFSPAMGLTTAVDNGEALFPHVGLGLELQAKLYGVTTGVDCAVVGLGPVTPGSEVTLTIDLEQSPVLLGRILGEDGQPVGEDHWDLTIWHTRSSSNMLVASDEEGRFRYVLPDSLQDKELIAITLASLSSTRPVPSLDRSGAAAPRAFGVARADLPARLPRGERDLGDLQLAPPSILIKGRVVDSQRNPLAGAQLALAELTHRTPAGKARWKSVRNRTGQNRSAEDGTFVLYAENSFDWRRGDKGGAELKLTVSHRDHFQPEPRLFKAGSEGQIIVLHQAGALAIELQLPEGMESCEQPAVHLVPAASYENRGARRLDWSSGREGEAIFRTVIPGAYSIQVKHICCLGSPLMEISGIWVEPGDTTRDSRLLPLDLRQEIRIVKLSLLDEAGQPFRGEVDLTPEVRGREEGSQMAIGEYLLPICVGAPRDVGIESDGYRSVILPNLDSDQSVVMTRDSLRP